MMDMSEPTLYPLTPTHVPPRFILDFETTGLDPVVDQVINVGLRGQAKYDAFVSDAVPTSREALAVHGLDPEICRALGRPSEEVLDCLLCLLGPGPIEVVAHNASFEKKFLEAWVARHKKKLPDIHWNCTLERAWELAPKAPFSCRLGELAQLFGWRTEGLHGAGVDAELTERLVEALDAWVEIRNTLGSNPGLIYLSGPFFADGTIEAMAQTRERMVGIGRWAQAVLPNATLVIPRLNYAFVDEPGKHMDRVRAQVLRSREALARGCQALIQCGHQLTEGMIQEAAAAELGGVPIFRFPASHGSGQQPEFKVRGVA